MRRGLAVGVAALVALVALAAASSASTGVQIAGVDTSGYPEVSLTVVGPPGGARPRLAENGRAVLGLQAVSLAARKRVVLAVDRSQSMRGSSLADATAAARAFVALKNPADDVQVVAFGQRATALGLFSSSRDAGDAAIARIGIDPVSGTALWDAVVLAARGLAAADPGEGRVIVVVTDGSDVSSAATPARAIAAARSAHAAVYAVGIASQSFDPDPLRELAAATGGAFVQASSSAQLVGLYRGIERSLARTWQLRYVTSEAPGARVSLAARVGAAISVERVVALGGSATPSADAPTVLSGSVWRSPFAPLVVAGAVGLIVLVAALFAFGSRRRDWLSARLAPHIGAAEPRAAKHERNGLRDIAKRVFAATERAFADVKQFRSLQRSLVRADLPLRAAELVYICLGAAVVPAAIGGLAGAPALVVFLLGWMGACVPVAFVTLKARSRIRAFDDQLPDLLTTIAASLKAGHSFRHAIQSVVEEGADPAAKEFRRVLAETRLGRTMDSALAELSERIGSENLAFALTAVTIQRQIGGSLAGLFDMVAETVRQRQQFARKIRALTAMGRMSAYVLIALPFFVGVVVSMINPSYMAPLWGTSTGHELVAAGVLMLGAGSLFLRKIVSFRG